MIRTQISLTETQAHKLRVLAARRDTSMSALIREAVDDILEPASATDPAARARSAIGAFRSGRDDISRDHDRHLDDAFST